MTPCEYCRDVSARAVPTVAGCTCAGPLDAEHERLKADDSGAANRHHQAPKPPFNTTWLYWCPTYSGVHHIDTHAGFHNGTRMHAVKVVRHELLVSAERRIAELEAQLDKARAEGREAGIREAGEVLDKGNAQTMGLMLDKARAEGREAGIREAADVMSVVGLSDTARRILELLDVVRP